MPPCSHFSTPHGSRAVFRCLHIPGLRCFHQGGPGATNGHEWQRQEEPRNTRNTRKKLRNHEWTRMDTNGYGEGRGGTTNGLNHETHEIHEKTREPRMDTNGHEWLWAGGRNHEWTRKNSEPRMDTNGHEWPWAGEGRFSTLWRPRPVDFQAELEKLDRERAGRGISRP